MIPLFLGWLGGWLTDLGIYRFVMVFDQLEFRVFCAGLLSFTLVVVFGKRVIRWLTLQKIGDNPDFGLEQVNELMKGKANTPTMGGVLIAGAMLVSLLLFGDLTNDYLVMALVVLVWHAGVGAADDWLKLTVARRTGSRQGLYSWEKLVFQLGIGVIVGYFAFQQGALGTVAGDGAEQAGRMAHVLNLPFQKSYEVANVGGPNPNLIYLSAIAYTAVMTLFMAGMSNAVNITDGMDGLAGGIATCVGVGLVVLALIAGSEELARGLLVPYVPASGELATVAAALAGACLGFLWWNASPAAVFMGDTGSLLIGGIIGYIAVVTRMEYVVLIMCGVYIWEILTVIMQVAYFKRTGGKRIFKCAPYHHHLHMSGRPEQRIVARFWILTVIATAVALVSIKLR